MRWMSVTLLSLLATTSLHAATPPLVENYLHSGKLAEGEKVLKAALKKNPKDDQARFGLAMLQLVQGVERLGQSLHRYGVKSENVNAPFVRLHVPANKNPETLTYRDFRRMLNGFHDDLSVVEKTLRGIKSDNVKLPLRLAAIHIDLDSDGKPTDKFADILNQILGGQRFDFMKQNPHFLVCWDRGDVAWLRAYCHLLMGMLDFYLAFDSKETFYLGADQWVAKPKRRFRGTEAERYDAIYKATREIVVKRPARLGRFRKHLVKVAELNHETWKHIRAETDNDHEWLPKPEQNSVLGLRVQNRMIDAWLDMMDELKALLEGDRVFLSFYFYKENNAGKRNGLNLKVLLDDPPKKFVPKIEFYRSLADKYYSNRKDVDINLIGRAFGMFSQPARMGYAAWFN